MDDDAITSVWLGLFSGFVISLIASLCMANKGEPSSTRFEAVNDFIVSCSEHNNFQYCVDEQVKAFDRHFYLNK